MISVFRPRSTFLMGSALMLALAVPAHGQDKEPHWRKYKKLAPAATITVTVEKAANGKPISNAAVIFRAKRDGKDEGSLEVKTNPDGQAKIDIIEVGSQVTVQVIAEGFATNASEFDVPTEEKSVVIRMEKPRAQVSVYQDNDGKASQRPAGVQEPPPIAKPKKVKPAKPAAPALTAPAEGAPVSPAQPKPTSQPQ